MGILKSWKTEKDEIKITCVNKNMYCPSEEELECLSSWDLLPSIFVTLNIEFQLKFITQVIITEMRR